MSRWSGERARLIDVDDPDREKVPPVVERVGFGEPNAGNGRTVWRELRLGRRELVAIVDCVAGCCVENDDKRVSDAEWSYYTRELKARKTSSTSSPMAMATAMVVVEVNTLLQSVVMWLSGAKQTTRDFPNLSLSDFLLWGDSTQYSTVYPAVYLSSNVKYKGLDSTDKPCLS